MKGHLTTALDRINIFLETPKPNLAHMEIGYKDN